MAVALILVLVALGSVIFHLVSPWWWTPIASNWHYIDNTIIITFWITGAVFVAVVLFMAYCVYRFRHQPGRQAHLRAGEQAARMVADDRHGRRRRGHADAGPLRLAAVHHRSGGRDRHRDLRASNGNGVSACPARMASSATRTRALSAPIIRSGSTGTIRNRRTMW